MKLWWWRDGDPWLTWSISFMRCGFRVKWVYCHGAAWADGLVVLWLAAGLGCLVLGWGRPCDWFCPDCCLRHGVDLGVEWRQPVSWGGPWPDFAEVGSVIGSDG